MLSDQTRKKWKDERQKKMFQMVLGEKSNQEKGSRNQKGEKGEKIAKTTL